MINGGGQKHVEKKDVLSAPTIWLGETAVLDSKQAGATSSGSGSTAARVSLSPWQFESDEMTMSEVASASHRRRRAAARDGCRDDGGGLRGRRDRRGGIPDIQDMATEIAPDLVFVDLQLARGTNGLDVSALLHKRWKNAIIVFVTGNPKVIPLDFCRCALGHRQAVLAQWLHVGDDLSPRGRHRSTAIDSQADGIVAVGTSRRLGTLTARGRSTASRNVARRCGFPTLLATIHGNPL